MNSGNFRVSLRYALRAVLPVAVVAGLSVVAYATLRQANSQTMASCQSNLKQFGLGMMMYVQDYDERFPPMKLNLQAQNRVYPYVKNRNVYSCPETGTAYLTNPALNYVYLAQVPSPASTMMLRDAQPQTTDSGKPGWNVAYADGHVKLEMTEPPLGKAAPTPAPPRPMTRAQQIRAQLEQLRQTRGAIDAQIRALEAEERRTRRRR
jgi:prepilin-type processing-associated H-X9-DG protein